jgi:hypothetical protein
MSAAHSSANSALLGNKECISVGPALSELQARRPIRISASGESFALPVDRLDEQRLGDFAVLLQSERAEPRRHATASALNRHQRSDSNGVTASRVVGVSTIFDLAANAENEGHFAETAEAASRAATAAIRLAKLSRSLPAVLAVDVMPNLDDDFMHLSLVRKRTRLIGLTRTRRMHLRSRARQQFHWRRAQRRALSCFGTLSAWLRSPSLSDNRFRFGFIRHA